MLAVSNKTLNLQIWSASRCQKRSCRHAALSYWTPLSAFSSRGTFNKLKVCKTNSNEKGKTSGQKETKNRGPQAQRSEFFPLFFYDFLSCAVVRRKGGKVDRYIGTKVDSRRHSSRANDRPVSTNGCQKARGNFRPRGVFVLAARSRREKHERWANERC